jgi:putative exosortase-associated protein (TIGR04073 family)
MIITKGIRVAAIAAILALLVPVMAQGVEYTAGRKAGRGLAGLTLGVLEVPGNIVQETRDHGAARGWSLGFVMGLGKIVSRTLVGAFELLTAPFPLPEGFKPVLEPEFPWDYFESRPPSR